MMTKLLCTALLLVSAQAWSCEFVRPYGAYADWNIAASGIAVHPQSTTYRDRLWLNGSDRAGNFNLSFTAYTFPVFCVANATTQAIVRVNNRGNLKGQTIPWNPNWQAASGTDGQVIILDPSTGREWNLYQASYSSATNTVTVTNGNLAPGDYHTRDVGFSPSRGAGIQYLAMLVRPWEVSSGTIRHALTLSVKNTDGCLYVAPATKLEHPENSCSGIPEGTRFKLNVSNTQIESWAVTRPSAYRNSGRIIAKALRDYGWIVTDTGSVAQSQFEDRITAGSQWDALGLKPGTINGKIYPRDMLDGLITPSRIVTLVPGDQY